MGFFKKKAKEEFLSPMEGIVRSLSDVPDPVFADKIMGDGFAIEPTGTKVVAPVSATVEAAFHTGHAFGLKAEDGTEILIHIGIDTVQLAGRGFDVKVSAGDKVKQGDTLVELDLELIRAEGKPTISPVIFTDGKKVTLLKKDQTVVLLEQGIAEISG